MHFQAKAMFQKLAEADPSTNVFKGHLAVSHSHIGRLLQQLNQPAQALAEFERESPIWAELAKGGDPAYREALAGCETNKTAVLLTLGRSGEARTSC
jgi:hypothetical protein